MPVEIEVPTEHLHEHLKEAHEHHQGHGDHGGEHGPAWIGQVALFTAVLAVTAAVAALLAGYHANEAMLEQMKATDQWAYYQAKGIKMSQVETKLQIIEAIGKEVSPAEKKQLEEDRQKIEKYEKQQEEIKEKAEELEHASERHMGHHERLAASVTAYQVAIAACAIAVLSKKKFAYFFGIALGVAGTVAFVLGLI